MPRLLIIAYYFPPWGMGGVQRVAKFAKYLPEFGWDVTVIAPKAGAYLNKDESLLDELPDSVRIERVEHHDSAFARMRGPKGPIRPILRWLSSWRDFPDRHRAFAALAVRRAHELMREESFDALLTSSPPPSIHIAGLDLKHAIPWIADFRDPWQALADDYGPTLFHRLKNSALHQRDLKSADAVVAVTPELRKHFEAECGGANVTVIRNGYDDADFIGLEAINARSPELRIVIPGTIGRFSDPRPLLYGLAVYKSQPTARPLRVTHVGATMDCDLGRMVKDAGLADVFQDLGYVDHRAAIRAMLDADIQMLSYTDPRVSDVSVPGRIYEMLRTQRPIVAVTPTSGALANLLAPLDGCEIVAPDDPSGIAQALARLAPTAGSGLTRPVSQLNSFERREQTRQLSVLCQAAIERRAGK